jgi:hypothetical protein
MDIVANADASFNELPAEIRAMFGNDAGEFFEFATNPENDAKMVELGLKAAPPSPQAPAQPAKKAEAKDEVESE